MKVKVVSVFKDKYTGEVYNAGKKLEVSKERYGEIKQFVEVLKAKKGQE